MKWLATLVDGAGGHEPLLPPTFLCSKKKKKQWKKRQRFKVETIKRLSPRSKCYCSSQSRASRIQKLFLSANHGDRQYFSMFHGLSLLKSISSALNNIRTLRSFCFSLIGVFTEVLTMFQLTRKAIKEVFHGHLTRLKFEELTEVKEIGKAADQRCS